jgi:ATP adenylyltransferase
VTAAEPCPFCEIAAGRDSSARVVFEDDHVVSFFPHDPATRGHTLVVPKRHVPDIWTVSSSEVEHLSRGVLRVAHALRAAFAPAGLNVIQSNGEAATQTVTHMHVHLVPRWARDHMVLDWPDTAARDSGEQEADVALVRRHLPDAPTGGTLIARPGLSSAGRIANGFGGASEEDRRQHLAFIQAVVNRMAQASSTTKSWLLPIATAAFGFALTQDSWSVALVGTVAVVVFGLLDSNYLKQERAFRNLYDEVARGGDIPAFALNPSLAAPDGTKSDYWPGRNEFKSWAILPVYLPMLLLGLGIAAFAICSP